MSHRPLASCPTVDSEASGRACPLWGISSHSWGCFQNLGLCPLGLQVVLCQANGLDLVSVLCSKRGKAAVLDILPYPCSAGYLRSHSGSGWFGDRRHNSVIINLLHSRELGTHCAVAPSRTGTVNAVAGMRLSLLDCTPQRILLFE